MFGRFTVPALAAVAVVGSLALLRAFAIYDAAPQPAAAAAVGGGHPPAALEPRSDGLIPARVRRLSNAEYTGSVAALLGSDLAPVHAFAPDARQAGFTENEAQRVDTVFARQLYSAAEKLAAGARPHFAQLAPCPTPADAEACAQSFIDRFGARAYRRPLIAEEASGLLGLYRAGSLDATYDDGIELVVRALLQSAGLLYLTELGNAPADGKPVALTEHELASELAYLMTGAPPDQQLLDAAAAGDLASAEARRSQLQRLRKEHPESRDQLVRMLREWLQLDTIENTAKDAAIYPRYEVLRNHFIKESQTFIAAVLDGEHKNASDLTTLLAANWTLGNKTLAKFYESPEEPDGRFNLPGRRGILNQGAFLSVQSHARESGPVLRGALIARRLACIPVPAPQSRGINVLPPPPDSKLTTRQRFELHTTSPVCAECHDSIDSFGNAFEQYDGMGTLRQAENGAHVDTTTEISVGADFDGKYADSNALAEALATSPTVRECFARYMFRAAAARSVDSHGATDTVASEDAFLAEWRTLPEIERGNVMDTLDAYVSSRLFTHRRSL